MNKKPFRLRVAKHYLKTGQKFSYLDIAHDFGMKDSIASSCFAGIALASRYITRLDKSAKPYEMTVMDIRKEVEYNKPMKKRKAKKPAQKANTVPEKEAKPEEPVKPNPKDEIAKLRAMFSGLRG